MSLESFQQLAESQEIHTVEVATADNFGHLRGKRVPVERFFETVTGSGVSMADAIFVMDIQNDLPENEFVNMESGYLDCRLIPDLSTHRILEHRPGYALVFSDALDEHHNPHPLAPRTVLANQIERCGAAGLEPLVATELEFYLCTPDWEPIQSHIQYSSLTDALGIEDVLHDMRDGLAGAGLEVESSNAEYGPGQFEINIGAADAMTTADNTVLFKSIVKQVAVQYGLRATFMAKPWAEQSGSGMHIHTSLTDSDGSNAFASSDGKPNDLMSKWVAGLLTHAEAMILLGSPFPNSLKRIRPYTFAPTHVNWGLDNRTIMARCITESGSAANRVEMRTPGADSNPYFTIAGVLAAGLDGIERNLTMPAMATGDAYTNPGDARVLPADLRSAIDAYAGSDLAGALGETFSKSYVSAAEGEIILAAGRGADLTADEVDGWERERFLEQT